MGYRSIPLQRAPALIWPQVTPPSVSWIHLVPRGVGAQCMVGTRVAPVSGSEWMLAISAPWRLEASGGWARLPALPPDWISAPTTALPPRGSRWLHPLPTTSAVPSQNAPTSRGASPAAVPSMPGSSGRSGTSRTSPTTYHLPHPLGTARGAGAPPAASSASSPPSFRAGESGGACVCLCYAGGRGRRFAVVGSPAPRIPASPGQGEA